MYPIGSKVVHPGHGAGTVTGIQQKNLGDVRRTYYVIATLAGSPGGARQLWVPVRRAEDTGLRAAGQPARLRAILRACQPPAGAQIDRDYRRRQAVLREALNSGSFQTVAGAVSLLHYLHTRRPLGVMDRQLYDHGKQILASELAVSANLEMGAALAEVEDLLAAAVGEA